MADELDEIRKLSPEERIKKIRELEEKRSKEKQGMEELLRVLPRAVSRGCR
ncbi:MAG: hypothetical protein NTZ02_02905 [Candidatus Woesearchaeota archaeon]|nr:hypothetical protein [Candidatus Woesearchaeota archaeon]